MDDATKQEILAVALAGADRNRVVYLKERELLDDPWARDLGISREVVRPIREIDLELTPRPYGVPTLYRCPCREAPIAAIAEPPPKVVRRPPPIELTMDRWADGKGPLYDVWLGQCPECRTIHWRIQRA